MGSYIYEQRESLAARHYVRKAGTTTYWFDFRMNKMEQYKERFGDAFCIVLFGSEVHDDAFVIPYNAIKSIFTPDTLDRHRRRWVGSITNGVLRLSPGRKSIRVDGFYNAFQELEDETDTAGSDILSPEVVEGASGELPLSELRRRIYLFNERFREVQPRVRLSMSRQIARPGLISDYVKRLRDYTCQLCSTKGFMQRTGVPYIEAYHIIELHRLIPGSYCSDNLVVVCPTCRKRLRYADVTYTINDPTEVHVMINDQGCTFERNIVSELE